MSSEAFPVVGGKFFAKISIRVVPVDLTTGQKVYSARKRLYRGSVLASMGKGLVCQALSCLTAMWQRKSVLVASYLAALAVCYYMHPPTRKTHPKCVHNSCLCYAIESAGWLAAAAESEKESDEQKRSE